MPSDGRVQFDPGPSGVISGCYDSGGKPQDRRLLGALPEGERRGVRVLPGQSPYVTDGGAQPAGLDPISWSLPSDNGFSPIIGQAQAWPFHAYGRTGIAENRGAISVYAICIT